MSLESEEKRIVNELSYGMRKRLRENSQKEWYGLYPDELKQIMVEQRAVAKLYREIRRGDPIAIKEQCADVSNFCAMIADQCKKLK